MTSSFVDLHWQEFSSSNLCHRRSNLLFPQLGNTSSAVDALLNETRPYSTSTPTKLAGQASINLSVRLFCPSMTSYVRYGVIVPKIEVA